MSAEFLDATGLLCPLPVLKARKRLAALAAGDVLTVHADDPGAKRDMAALCQTQGHRLLSARQEGNLLIFEIRKG